MKPIGSKYPGNGWPLTAEALAAAQPRLFHSNSRFNFYRDGAASAPWVLKSSRAMPADAAA